MNSFLFSVMVIIGIVIFPLSFSLFLTLVIGFLQKREDFQKPAYLKKFAIVIPAHNESLLIGRTLESVLSVDYPKHLYDIYVIADNCSDNTADIARKMQVQCLERFEPERRGKGYALKWFFKYAMASNLPCDLFLILDADTLVTQNILMAMNKGFSAGRHAVLNTRSDIINPESSLTASIAFLGYATRSLRRKGLALLGGSAPIISNGIGFARKVIETYGWDATSITEDREQWALLYLKGLNVGAVDEASVSTIVPDTFRDFQVPRARWDIGELEVNRKYLIPFLKIFLEKKDIASLLNFLEILTPPFTYFFIICIVFFIISVAMFIHSDYKGLSIVLLWSMNTLLLGIGSFIALVKSKATSKVYKNLTYLPIFALWRIFNLLRGYLQNDGKEWIKSKRGVKR